MIIGILKEYGNENRVAMLPGEVAVLKKLGVEVVVEQGAGKNAFVSDEEYFYAGASVSGRKELIAKASLLLSVNPPLREDINSFSAGQILCSVVNPAETGNCLDNARTQWFRALSPLHDPITTGARS